MTAFTLTTAEVTNRNIYKSLENFAPPPALDLQGIPPGHVGCRHQFDPIRCFFGPLFGVSPPHGRRRFCKDSGPVRKSVDKSVLLRTQERFGMAHLVKTRLRRKGHSNSIKITKMTPNTAVPGIYVISIKHINNPQIRFS